MSSSHNLQHAKIDLKPHWILVAITALMLAVYLYLCHYTGAQWQQDIPEEQRVIIRTVFYILAIIGFPMTNLIRHIQLRLNQTMPGDKSAKNRYLLTIIVSMTLVPDPAEQGELDPGVALLRKPFSPFSLAQKVREVLDGPGRLDQ